MARKLENGRENLMIKAKEILISQGYDALNIKSLTSECNMGAGTFYGYFSKKDELVLQVMQKDWDAFLDTVDSEIVPGCSHLEGARCIYEQIEAFTKNYITVVRGLTMGNSPFAMDCLRIKEANLQKLYDVVAKKFRAESAMGGLKFDLDIEKAARFYVGLCISTSTDPKLTFDDLWRFLYFRDSQIRR
jgi:AcrR family transcriptional regulator